MFRGCRTRHGECQIRSTSSYSFQRSSEKQPACFADGCDRYLLIGGAGKIVLGKSLSCHINYSHSWFEIVLKPCQQNDVTVVESNSILQILRDATSNPFAWSVAQRDNQRNLYNVTIRESLSSWGMFYFSNLHCRIENALRNQTNENVFRISHI